MPRPLTTLLADSLDLWAACPTTFTPPGRVYTKEEQAANEAQLEESRAVIRSGERNHRVLASVFVRFAKSALALEDRHAALLLDGGFSTIAPDLEKQARALDPAVTDPEILQACRNAWAACGLQCLCGQPMGLTPSIFGYSMLYPYTDNRLDDAAISRESKLAFSRRFRQRLAGESLPPSSPFEDAVWRLIALIESQYSRARYPQVFCSLLDIHQAQEQSLQMLESCPDPLPLIFAKGGASVLADVYLAAGTPTDAQAAFAFAWGVLLQLGDDLQDVTEDRAANCVTLFTEAAAHGTLDALTNRTLHFAHTVLGTAGDLVAGSSPTLYDLISRSTFALLVRAAAKNRAHYSSSYIQTLEPYSPVPFHTAHSFSLLKC